MPWASHTPNHQLSSPPLISLQLIRDQGERERERERVHKGVAVGEEGELGQPPPAAMLRRHSSVRGVGECERG